MIIIKIKRSFSNFLPQYKHIFKLEKVKEPNFEMEDTNFEFKLNEIFKQKKYLLVSISFIQ